MPAKQSGNLTWTKVGPGEYNAENETHDFSIQKQDASSWVVDIFDSKIEDPDEAHLSSDEYSSLAESKAAVEEFCTKDKSK